MSYWLFEVDCAAVINVQFSQGSINRKNKSRNGDCLQHEYVTFFWIEGSTNISRGTIDSHHFIPVSETLHAFID